MIISAVVNDMRVKEGADLEEQNLILDSRVVKPSEDLLGEVSTGQGLKVCVLGSGSSGNCTYIGTSVSGILIDAGLSYRETELRLAAVGVEPGMVKAVCVTHEHHDHVSSLGVLYRRLNVPLYANAGTIDAIELKEKLRGLPWNVFTNGSRFKIAGLSVEPFSVPHDAYDPVGFLVDSGGARAGIVTDMGTATELIRNRLKSCDVIVVECNHDGDLLRDSSRPWSLKQRIQGRQGHLSNDQAVDFLRQTAGPQTRAVYLAHLSSDCNNPDVALRCVREALVDAGFGSIRVSLTYPDKVSEVFDLGKL